MSVLVVLRHAALGVTKPNRNTNEMGIVATAQEPIGSGFGAHDCAIVWGAPTLAGVGLGRCSLIRVGVLRTALVVRLKQTLSHDCERRLSG